MPLFLSFFAMKSTEKLEKGDTQLATYPAIDFSVKSTIFSIIIRVDYLHTHVKFYCAFIGRNNFVQKSMIYNEKIAFLVKMGFSHHLSPSRHFFIFKWKIVYCYLSCFRKKLFSIKITALSPVTSSFYIIFIEFICL